MKPAAKYIARLDRYIVGESRNSSWGRGGGGSGPSKRKVRGNFQTDKQKETAPRICHCMPYFVTESGTSTNWECVSFYGGHGVNAVLTSKLGP